MNYYERHIGDYLKDTAHLSLLEHGVYTRLMDVYYTREGAIPAKEAARLIGARSKDEREALQLVLAEFFVLVDDAHRQDRCEREIERYQDKQRKASASANARWAKGQSHTERNANASPDAMRTHSEGNAPRARPQTPDTRPTTEAELPSLSPARPTRPLKRCPESFAMTDDLVQWARENAPGISIASETAKFRDHTFSRGITDWPATWRNWMRKALEDHRKRPANAGPGEPEWRREQRERNEAFLGPAAAKRSAPTAELPLEILDVAARRVG